MHWTKLLPSTQREERPREKKGRYPFTPWKNLCVIIVVVLLSLLSSDNANCVRYCYVLPLNSLSSKRCCSSCRWNPFHYNEIFICFWHSGTPSNLSLCCLLSLLTFLPSLSPFSFGFLLSLSPHHLTLYLPSLHASHTLSHSSLLFPLHPSLLAFTSLSAFYLTLYPHFSPSECQTIFPFFIAF